jgi:hypothetical protein
MEMKHTKNLRTGADCFRPMSHIMERRKRMLVIAPAVDRERGKISLQKVEIPNSQIKRVRVNNSLDIGSTAGPQVLIETKAGPWIKGVWLKNG